MRHLLLVILTLLAKGTVPYAAESSSATTHSAAAAGSGATTTGTETATTRLDFFHTGSERDEIFSLDRWIVEPLPWPGNPSRPIDTLGLGTYRFEVVRPATAEVLYSRGFSSIFAEWVTTPEARLGHRTFHESLRFPHPGEPVELVVEKRLPDQTFAEVWRLPFDPSDIFIDTSAVAAPKLSSLHHSGEPAHKVDLLLLGDGYTRADCAIFENQAKKLVAALFQTEPFARRRGDFNVWGLCPPADQSGVSRPSTGAHHRSPVGSTYDAFGSERYVLTFDNRSFRDLAAHAPYDVVEILVHSETYGGGGIFGLYSTVAAGNDWAEYLFLHEFGHHFAGLADEYYTSSVAYEIPESPVEPWEVNATALLDPERLKWRHLVAPDTPIPSPWPKESFEKHSRRIQERRKQLRSDLRPEREMSQLFEEQRAFETDLLGKNPLAGKVGAFEGAMYSQRGLFRPQLDCIMFSRNPVPFCTVCQQGIEAVIDLYTSATPRSE